MIRPPLIGSKNSAKHVLTLKISQLLTRTHSITGMISLKGLVTAQKPQIQTRLLCKLLKYHNTISVINLFYNDLLKDLLIQGIFRNCFTNMTIATDSPEYFRKSSLTQKKSRSITQCLNVLPHTRPANIECVIQSRTGGTIKS